MATGSGQQRDKSRGNDNRPSGRVSHDDMTGAGGSPRIQGTWSRKHNTGGKEKVNSKRISVG